MDSTVDSIQVGERPHHRRNKSSRSVFKALVASKPKPESNDDYPKPHPLGERQLNMQSPPPSPSKLVHRTQVTAQTSAMPSSKSRDLLKKSKSTTNIASVFGKKNRSSKDLTNVGDVNKENSTPPSSSHAPTETPIWAQLATSPMTSNHAETNDVQSFRDIHDEIAKYMPQDYSPSKQRNFNGSFDQPGLRPRLAGAEPGKTSSVFSRRANGTQASTDERTSIETGGRKGIDTARGPLANKEHHMGRVDTGRHRSGSSTEQIPPKERLTIAKRTGRVMAAVAAFQGRGRTEPVKEDAPLDPKTVDEAFETVLASRNVPEPMREKMRSLTLRVKTDFIKQNQGPRIAESSPMSAIDRQSISAGSDGVSTPDLKPSDDNSKATKRSRSRSRTFTFSKAEKRGDASPSKKARSRSKTRSISTTGSGDPSAAASSGGNLGRVRAVVATPADYIAYLMKNQDPTQTEVGRLHKLRILLRNETVSWVDSFVSLGGMAEIVGLLHRIMGVEWREEHEDQLLHETLLCLKGLCTTERAMSELEKVADDLFPALLGMLFDDEKKGPAEYTTRAVIINILFNYLESATNSGRDELETRARKVLTYLNEPSKPEDSRPVDFVLNMQVSRPFKLWSREVSNVTREVFWIFLHHLNVVPLPKTTDVESPADGESPRDSETQAKLLASTYTRRHFPGARPPVPAAPYIGGVEWDATTYLTAHIDLMNGLIASIPSSEARNTLREQLQASGFEKVMGSTLRTCKEKFYSGVHDGLRCWVAASSEDGWDTALVREGPTLEEQAERARSCSPKKSPKKKSDPAPKLDLNLALGGTKKDDDDGWLG